VSELLLVLAVFLFAFVAALGGFVIGWWIVLAAIEEKK
jgi:hypothetical protein